MPLQVILTLSMVILSATAALAQGEANIVLPPMSQSDVTILWGVLGSALIALAYGLYLVKRVISQDPGSPAMREVAAAIEEGAMAYLWRQVKTMIWLVIILFIALYLLYRPIYGHMGKPVLAWGIAIAFLMGVGASYAAGYVGMWLAVKGNVRTANQALRTFKGALETAFRAGTVSGMFTVGLGLLGATIIFLVFRGDAMRVLIGFGFGGSLAALFMRVGGGIFTKAADVGADLVGKVEAGIPEDHPLNPATIADNVGDNVGDVAGMGADLFESYVGALISAMILGVAWTQGLSAINPGLALNAVYLPLVIALVGIVSSIVGFFFVRTQEGGNPQAGLNRGTFVAGALMLVGTVFAIRAMIPAAGVPVPDIITGEVMTHRWWGVAFAVVGGLVAGIAIGMLTEYYTATFKNPVQTIVDAAKTGPATTLIQGIAVGMNSTTFPVLVIGAAILVAYGFAGLYGIALAGVGMLSTLAIQLATDAYGPIADNAGGVAEMSRLGRDIRARTDKLDAVGNTTAAIGKGFAIGSAALTALALTAAYLTKMGGKVQINAADPYVLVGLLIGCMLPFRFSAMAMVAVGKAAQDMIQEVRRQFRDIPELKPALLAAEKAESEDREPTPEEQKIIRAADGKAEYAHCVDIATAAAIKKMVAPGLMAIIVPLLVGIYSPNMLGGLLVGVTISGVCLAIFQANAGGAWDNSKKQVKEQGHKVYGDAYDAMHKATVTGDTVGDPFKDTSGPSLNILIKLISVVAMILAPIFYAIHFG